MSIVKLSNQDLLWKLRNQYPYGVTSFAPCPKCKKSSRGGDYCKSCLICELRERGVGGGLLNHYCQMQNRRLNILTKLEEAESRILRELDE